VKRAKLGLRHVVAPEELWTVGRGAVPTDEEVHVANVVGLEHDDGLRRQGLDAVPDSARRRRWGKRIEQQRGVARAHTERRNLGRPILLSTLAGSGVVALSAACERWNDHP
jgi:hypothetical protein